MVCSAGYLDDVRGHMIASALPWVYVSLEVNVNVLKYQVQQWLPIFVTVLHTQQPASCCGMFVSFIYEIVAKVSCTYISQGPNSKI
jgi:hypothetical protein